MSIDMLDLREIADEWQELLDEPETLDAEDVAKYAELCEQLGVSPPEPDTLKWWADNHDPALIPEGDFEEYAEQLAEDIGAIGSDAQWPIYCIDWKRAASDLAVDYSSITYDGTDYYYRGD